MVVNINLIKQGEIMFSLKKRMGRPPKNYGERATYRQVAVTPQAHARLCQIADKRNQSIIDTVSQLVGV